MEFSQALATKNKQQRNAPCIAVLGTGSDVGKSVVATALCRVFVNRGVRVAPFKAQNMSNNSGVTPEGFEMGRAQIVQAEAAKISPHVDMNPVLLKPTAELGSQVVLLGSVAEAGNSGGENVDHEWLFKKASDALGRLRQEYDLIILEGAGSCAEVNLTPRDFVNFRTAAFADAPVLLVADIDRGGVFAQIIGTLECLEPNQRARIAGFIINRFRGDIELFKDGVRWIEEKTAKPVFGVLPWYSHIQIEPEDSVVIENPKKIDIKISQNPAVAVIRLPHISNFNDFNPLLALDQLDVCFLEKLQALTAFRAVILPGSKNTRFDLNWLRVSGWTKALSDYVESGGHVLGICGGYQMMGKTVNDPQGLEGQPGISNGLGLLPIETVLQAPKTTTLTQFSWNGQPGTGYEIHMGQTTRKGENPLFKITHRNHHPCRDEDGCVSADSKMMGTYIHGLFDNPSILKSWLNHIGLDGIDVSDIGGIEARNRQYDLLAEHFQKHVDVDRIIQLVIDRDRRNILFLGS
ncbi:MAG: cobyric acid synthase [Deltaproteobacteria bacterium]|jgi:adenosylcobyric acid synthase|nr:cobyric acid synthase [Deltaproteobacteria bacterium]